MAYEETGKQNKGKFYLDKVVGEVKLTKTIILALFETKRFEGVTRVWKHQK